MLFSFCFVPTCGLETGNEPSSPEWANLSLKRIYMLFLGDWQSLNNILHLLNSCMPSLFRTSTLAFRSSTETFSFTHAVVVYAVWVLMEHVLSRVLERVQSSLCSDCCYVSSGTFLLVIRDKLNSLYQEKSGVQLDKTIIHSSLCFLLILTLWLCHVVLWKILKFNDLQAVNINLMKYLKLSGIKLIVKKHFYLVILSVQ